MQFRHAFDVVCPPERALVLLRDVSALLGCLPGCRSAEAAGEGRYRVVVAERVGPFRVQFSLDAQVSEPAPGRLEARASGRDAAMGASADVRLVLAAGPSPDGGGTHVDLDAEVQVLGKLAALGFPVMQRKAEESMAAFADNVRRRLEGGSEQP